MRDSKKQGKAAGLTRRGFLKTAGAASAAVAATGLGARLAYAAGSDRLRVGLIGCGGRGTGAAQDCLNAAPGMELVALGDLFKDRLDGARSALSKLGPEKYKVTPDKCFVGFDAYQKVIASGVDYVILATPPGFRPIHFKAAIEAGKHVFMEKPVGVDPVGIRMVLEAGALADQKKLCVVAGTQRRHQLSYVETVKRLRDGAIGEIVAGRCHWNQGELWVVDRNAGMGDMEWQIRNWLYFTWLSGDHIVEQHVHNIDVINWVMGSPPAKALAVGGRQVRTAPKYGHIYDHFAVDFEYPNGVHVLSTCCQMPGVTHRVSEAVVGTKGKADPSGWIDGPNGFRYQGPNPNPYVQEHADLIASIRSGNHINETQNVAESTLAAIMGRMSAYTGREISWNWVLKESKLDLVPKKFDLKMALPVEPVAMPGTTKLI